MTLLPPDFNKKLDFSLEFLYYIYMSEGMKESDFDKAVNLLDQVIEKSSLDDKIEARQNMMMARDGDGWITYHLKLVKELLQENAEDKK